MSFRKRNIARRSSLGENVDIETAVERFRGYEVCSRRDLSR